MISLLVKSQSTCKSYDHYIDLEMLAIVDATLAARLLGKQVECEYGLNALHCEHYEVCHSARSWEEEEEMDETSEHHTTAGYFIAIIAVLGGALLMPSFAVFFTTIGPLLLLVLTPVLLIGYAQYREQKRLLAKQDMTACYSQEPVAVSQSSTSSDMCDNAPWR
jgi:hypothetical protein